MKKVTAAAVTLPGPGRPPNRVRSFVKSKLPVPKNTSSLFNEEGTKNSIDLTEVQDARKTGILNLASKNLSQIPTKVWSLNDIQKEEKDVLSVALDSQADQRWWEFQELQKLVVANNCIAEIPTDIQRLTCLQIFDAHDNHIRLIPKEIGVLEDMIKIDFSRNRIELLPAELYRLRKLTELRLGHNNLRELSSELGNLSNLSVLELSNNQLTMLPPDIGFLSSLTTLNLCKNKLEQLPTDFSGLTGLRHLDLSENLLTDVGSLLSQFSHLEILYLQQNKVKRIPALGNASKLTEIYMRDNQVQEFSSSSFFGTVIRLIDLRTNKISKLEIGSEDLRLLDRLYLDNNNIEILPDQLCLLPALKQLTLEGNPLKGIRVDILQRGSVELLKYLRGRLIGSPVSHESLGPATRKSRNHSGGCTGTGTHLPEPELVVDVHKLKQSGQLSISPGKLVEIPDDVFVAAAEAKVGKVNLSHNLLSSFPSSFEGACTKLRELDLDQNKFLELPSYIGSASPHLYYLTFQNNQIRTLPKEFANLQNLREINFSFNKFTSIPSCLYELPVLEIILAQDNKIESIDVDGLKKLPRLATLNLDNNSISHCPPELGFLPLTRLSIQGNSFRIPPYHILAKGTEATMTYLRNRVVPPK